MLFKTALRIIVHELMHLKRLDHSPKFWKLVAAACPKYKEARAWLQARGDGVCIEQRTAEMVDLPQKPWCRVASGREVAASHSAACVRAWTRIALSLPKSAGV